MDDSEIQQFLEEVYEEDSKAHSIDLIYEFMDDLTVWERRFNDTMEGLGGPRILDESDTAIAPNLSAIARLFELVDVTKLNSTEMVGFLCTTLPYKDNFPERDAFVKRAKKQLRDEGRGLLSVRKLFKNLE